MYNCTCPRDVHQKKLLHRVPKLYRQTICNAAKRTDDILQFFRRLKNIFIWNFFLNQMSIINDKSRLCHATFNNRMAKNVGAEQMYNSLSHTHMLPFAALRAI